MNKEEKIINSTVSFGIFKDEALEKEYYNLEITKDLKYIKLILMMTGVIYFLFIIPDYFLIKNCSTLTFILINRIIVFVLTLILYARIKYGNNYFSLVYWFTAYEIIISISFLHISNKYPSPDFLIQVFGVMLIILAIFLINNRWMYNILASLFISISFFALAVIDFKGIPFSKFSAAVVYILIVIFISSISSYRINYYKRIQYINNAELLRMAETDPLTEIYNKAKFNREYARLIEGIKEKNTCFFIVIFDIDDFKIVNDRYGHLAGDKTLIELARIIANKIRKPDIFARWGGEEFVIIFSDVQAQQAFEATEQLRILISEHYFDGVGHITCSFGIATFKNGDDVDKVLSHADERLYMAKKAGKNRVM